MTGKEKKIKLYLKSIFWFIIGASLGLFFFSSFLFFIFQKTYSGSVYPGIAINGKDFGGKTEKEVKNFFQNKNEKIQDTKFTFKIEDNIATISAKELDFGYDGDLLAKQAFSLGRSDNILSDISLVSQAYLNSINIPASYHFQNEKLEEFIMPIAKKVNVKPTEALFTFQALDSNGKEGKVSVFRPSLDGREINMEELKNLVSSKSITLLMLEKPQEITIKIPVRILKPEITTEKANSLGIKELIGTGNSTFRHSIQNRIFNITLASARLNGILISPGETFSFNKALGDISAFTGYQQAYVIQNGRTVLGDGGGVCQVSTTLFRAVLNAGLPIAERHAHAYRVGYYEQDSDPGFDATVYSPSVDFRFKNDTGNYILIQTFIDPNSERLSFLLYGTKDERESQISSAVITSQSPPPAPLYQDEPSLEKGVLKQVDFPAAGANVYFTRQVIKNGKVIISDKFVSGYKPWQAVYLRGTKE